MATFCALINGRGCSLKEKSPLETREMMICGFNYCICVRVHTLQSLPLSRSFTALSGVARANTLIKDTAAAALPVL